MYRITGADGKEYGPISSDVLRLWISQGRANAQTKVLPEGATEWITLSQLPEFAADLAAKAAAPTSPTLSPNAMSTPNVAEAITAEMLARDYQLEIGRCFSRGWDLVKKHFWLTVGATFLIHLIASAVASVPILGLAFTYVFVGGLDLMFLKLIRGEKAEVGDAFAGFNLAFGPLAFFSLVAQLLAILGFLFCILPGIYLSVCWMLFTPLIIIDKRIDFWPAMELARKVVTRHWWQVFGFALLGVLLMFAGTLACFIGVFIAMPVVKAATVYAYEDIFGARTITPAPVTT
jgi:hypothetical protein